MPRDERRAQILGAAATAFAESGFAATSMADVARAAGITKLIVYRHFDSKADLYREILEQVARRLADEWLTVSDVEHSGGHSARVLLAAARAHPDGFRLLFVHAPREPEFASYHADFRAIQIDLADRLFAPYVEEALIRDWRTSTGQPAPRACSRNRSSGRTATGCDTAASSGRSLAESE